MSPALAIHICGGVTGLVTGSVALVVRKGGRLHRASGDIYVIGMIVMGGAAAWLAASMPDWRNMPGGLFAAYLVVTGWTALARNRPLARLAEEVGLVLGGAAGASALLLAVQGAANVPGLLILAGLSAFAVLLDLRTLHFAQTRPRPDLARHIWRMCAALFVATGSFFLGQQQVMPPWMRGSPLLFVPAVAPLVLMAFWLARTALSRGLRDRLAPVPKRTLEAVAP